MRSASHPYAEHQIWAQEQPKWKRQLGLNYPSRIGTSHLLLPFTKKERKLRLLLSRWLWVKFQISSARFLYITRHKTMQITKTNNSNTIKIYKQVFSCCVRTRNTSSLKLLCLQGWVPLHFCLYVSDRNHDAHKFTGGLPWLMALKVSDLLWKQLIP